MMPTYCYQLLSFYTLIITNIISSKLLVCLFISLFHPKFVVDLYLFSVLFLIPINENAIQSLSKNTNSLLILISNNYGKLI